MAHEEIKNIHTSEGVPQPHFDQLNAMSHHLHAIKHNAESWTPPQPCPLEDNAQHHATINGMLPVKLTRRTVKEQSDWELWEQSEFKQHDACEAQDMFGEPIPPPPPTMDANSDTAEVTILPFVWTHPCKEGTMPKARGTCNGGNR